jgi:hypothetical protein
MMNQDFKGSGHGLILVLYGHFLDRLRKTPETSVRMAVLVARIQTKTFQIQAWGVSIRPTCSGRLMLFSSWMFIMTLSVWRLYTSLGGRMNDEFGALVD